MRPTAIALVLVSVCALVGAAPTVAGLIGTDPFCLVSAASGGAVSLQDSRSAAGTRAMLAELLEGKRTDQALLLLPSGEAGYYRLGVKGTGRVLEAQDPGRETVVLLADPAGREGQKWRLESEGPGRYRVVSKPGGRLLTAVTGLRAEVTVAAASGLPEQQWRIVLNPVLVGEVGPDAPTLEERYPTLARQLVVNREPWLDHLLASRRLQDYLAGAPTELRKGMSLVLLDRVYTLAPDERNYALTLLLWLLTQAAYTREDTITVALALANASLYASGDEEVRTQIRRDVVSHYKLYRAVVDWQEGWAIGYRLKGMPLMAKVLWCYRSNQVERNGDTLTLEEYRTFVDRLDVLTEMHELARANDVGEAPSLRAVVLNVDALFRVAYHYAHFMAMIRQWYTPDAPLPEKATDDELYAYLTKPEVDKLLPDWVHEVLQDYRNGTYYVEVLGRRRDPQARMWVNYQWQLYRDTGSFRGDCGTEAEVSMALWKAAGLVALSFYHTGKDIGHAYPAYYDPFLGRFLSLQDLSYMQEKPGATAEVTLHPMPLAIHDRLPVLRPQPKTLVASYTRFVARGMDYALFERLMLDAGAEASDGVFTPESCPAERLDADRDGLGDDDEAALGTRADQADTDGDGFADLWEVERRFDPRDATTPSKTELGRVLVGHVVRVGSARTGASLDPAGGAGVNHVLYRIVRSDEAQYHFIVVAASGLCLSVGDQGRLLESPLAGSAAQKWKLLFRDRGAFVIQSRADGKVIALENGQELAVRAPRATPDELWVIR